MKTLSKNNGLKKLAKLNINKTSIAYKVVSELLGSQVGKYSTYMVRNIVTGKQIGRAHV